MVAEGLQRSGSSIAHLTGLAVTYDGEAAWCCHSYGMITDTLQLIVLWNHHYSTTLCRKQLRLLLERCLRVLSQISGTLGESTTHVFDAALCDLHCVGCIHTIRCLSHCV